MSQNGLFNKLSKENVQILSLSGGQVFRLKEEKDIPKTSTIGNKRSDIIGNLKFIPSDAFSLDYSFSINKDLNDLNYNYAETNFLVNNFNVVLKPFQNTLLIIM